MKSENSKFVIQVFLLVFMAVFVLGVFAGNWLGGTRAERAARSWLYDANDYSALVALDAAKEKLSRGDTNVTEELNACRAQILEKQKRVDELRFWLLGEREADE